MSEFSTMIIKITFFLIINVGIFFLDQSEATKTKPISDGPTPSPLPSHSEKEIPSPQYKHFLEECEKRITEKCAHEIFKEIFENKTISNNCCSELVDMGPDCQSIMIQREKDLLKNKNEKNTIVQKSEDLWKRCSKITPMDKKRQYPKVPQRMYLPGYDNFLKGCEEELTEKCGAQVLGFVFKKNETANVVDKGCCSKLLKMGHDCHDEMHVRLQRLADRKKEKSDFVKEKGHQIWKYCEEIIAHN
ncbi:hypothetical protein ABFS82_11G123000 [Erythranthe guttata]|uniref:Prolamin-like domain-containing protein n=1 Tax=Erythranthe guttata TaxID=4155 RepID=A0A022R354_ERYGU|nr:PREDICTED: uncharacterized protein LOC105960858 [Erythranthe guttata]EYU34651.1 hypothetical protein MIMGU_mgv1a019108mg [Erythranthe guttata]|eukprot:XP_012840522.1 PREDICTED: uncharacterized protein LOC105960858 [Erythranthe guttata]